MTHSLNVFIFSLCSPSAKSSLSKCAQNHPSIQTHTIVCHAKRPLTIEFKFHMQIQPSGQQQEMSSFLTAKISALTPMLTFPLGHNWLRAPKLWSTDSAFRSSFKTAEIKWEAFYSCTGRFLCQNKKKKRLAFWWYGKRDKQSCLIVWGISKLIWLEVATGEYMILYV